MGFALVEVILATAILSGGLLMVVRVFPLALRTEQKVERHSTASLLGQTLMEEIKRREYDDLSEAFPEETTGHGTGEGEFEEYQEYSYQVDWWDTETPNLRKGTSSLEKSVNDYVSWLREEKIAKDITEFA